jgi:N-acetylneuraminate synthase/N,N'-diacetyllegionaminate synthase
VKILNKYFFSKKNPVLYIAEIGGNHEGSFKYAKILTQLAIESGADAIKFQFYTGDTLVSRIEGGSRNEHFKKFELSNEQNLELIGLVSASGAMPMASVWSKEMLSWADPHLSYHKVGSGDLTCYPMLSALAATDKPMILSTGLSSLREVESAVAYIEKYNPSYISHRKLALLQCTSSYPTPDEDANINAMLTLKREFGLPVGYSDHTLGADAIEIAVSMGAEIIEKHFTDTREGKTFRDHHVSLTRDEVQKTLDKMRRIVVFKGSGEKILTMSEREARHHVTFRRGIYIKKSVNIGEFLTAENLTVLRPFHDICASRFDEVLGQKATRRLVVNHALKEGDFEKI